MSLVTILVLLQAAISLLTSSIGQSPVVQQQAINFANQAMTIANEAEQVPGTTTLEDTVTTSTPPAFPQVSEGDNGIGGSVPVIAPVSAEVVVPDATATEAVPVVKNEVPFDSVGKVIVNTGPHDVYFETRTGTSTTWTFTVNGQTVTDLNGLHLGGLTAATQYDYTVRFEGDDWFATSSGSFTTAIQ